MIRYEFKDAPLTIKNAKKADPQKIGEAIDKVATANDGHIKPAAIVEAARASRSPLHRHFEWDDEKAADAYRIEQARTLIRSIRTIDDTGDAKPAFLSVNEKAGVSYRTFSDVMSSTDLQYAVLKQADRDLEAWESRYQELTDICKVVSTARGMLSKKIESDDRPSA